MKRNTLSAHYGFALKLACLLVAASAAGCALDASYIEDYEGVIGKDGKRCDDIQYIELSDGIRIYCTLDEDDVCTRDGIEVTQNGEVIDPTEYYKYYTSFYSDRCPSQMNCNVSGKQKYCGWGVSACPDGKHSYNGGCEDDSIDNCGKHCQTTRKFESPRHFINNMKCRKRRNDNENTRMGLSKIRIQTVWTRTRFGTKTASG